MALIALFALVGVGAQPASAWKAMGPTWGPAPQAVTYDLLPPGDPTRARYYIMLEDAMRHVEGVLDGRVTFHSMKHTEYTPVGFFVHAEYFGNTVWAAQWRGKTCDTRFCPSGVLAINDYWLSDYSDDANELRFVMLHELGHVIGLDHENLHTNDPVPSRCNIMYPTIEPFKSGGWFNGDGSIYVGPGECAGEGHFWKNDDILGGITLYPPRDPPGGGGGGPILDTGSIPGIGG